MKIIFSKCQMLSVFAQVITVWSVIFENTICIDVYDQPATKTLRWLSDNANHSCENAIVASYVATVYVRITKIKFLITI